jgi:hypothetical protein
MSRGGVMNPACEHQTSRHQCIENGRAIIDRLHPDDSSQEDRLAAMWMCGAAT